MAGRNKEAENATKTLAREQLGLSREFMDAYRERTGRMDEYLAPTIQRNQALASGDSTKALQTMAIPMANITRGAAAARENIFDSVPSGAAREFALGKSYRDEAGEKAAAMNQAFLGSFDQLAKIGEMIGNFGLQQSGAGLRAGEGAFQSNKSMLDYENQRKAAQMGFLGQVAQAAGGAAGAKLG